MNSSVIGSSCKVGKSNATITGYIVWGTKLRYYWVKFQEAEELIKPTKVKLL